MAKTKYGQRMYRARKENAAEMQAEGAREFTYNASRGESIVVEESAIADEYRVTQLLGGEIVPLSAHTADASSIKTVYGVDLWKGQLQSGVTTNDLSNAVRYVRLANSGNNSLAYKVQNYLTKQEDASTFTDSDINALYTAMNYARNHPYTMGSSDAVRVLGSLIVRIDRESGRAL